MGMSFFSLLELRRADCHRAKRAFPLPGWRVEISGIIFLGILGSPKNPQQCSIRGTLLWLLLRAGVTDRSGFIFKRLRQQPKAPLRSALSLRQPSSLRWPPGE
jgi:hypothetical protein